MWLISLEDEEVFRISDFRFPLWGMQNREPARFHSAGDPPTQYFASHPLGTYPELLRETERARGRRVLAGDVAAAQNFKLWTLKLTTNDAFELNFDSAPIVGLTPDELVADDHQACRVAGRTYGHLDPEFPKVWRYTSASFPGTVNFAVFGPRVMSEYLRPALTPGDVPGTLAANHARAAGLVLDHMRHIGESHDELDHFRLGQVYDWVQPVDFP
jgi:hypothetical protein